MNDFDTFWHEAKAALRVALQWFFLAVPMGLLCGFLGTLFHLAVEHATELRAAQPCHDHKLNAALALAADAHGLHRAPRLMLSTAIDSPQLIGPWRPVLLLPARGLQRMGDDQLDMLNGALAYVSTHPKYKSRYYETGYPDDGYGVCTDVVAYALKNAGYDLQELVDADIREQPQDYMVEEPDANIDFRRVRNLKVFFAHTAAALTTDVSEIEEWQGGDIVIFERHIGIVSDRRNKNGVPYIIHHNDPWQTAYEQDILEKRTDIVGHYRISQ